MSIGLVLLLAFPRCTHFFAVSASSASSGGVIVGISSCQRSRDDGFKR